MALGTPFREVKRPPQPRTFTFIEEYMPLHSHSPTQTSISTPSTSELISDLSPDPFSSTSPQDPRKIETDRMSPARRYQNVINVLRNGRLGLSGDTRFPSLSLFHFPTFT